MKNNTFKVTFCGIAVALSTVFMLLSYFPYLTYAIPAITGLLTMVIVIEIGVKWALCAYFAASVLIFIFAEPESKLMYICLFGYYPILKALVERIGKAVPEWIIKFAVFNASALTVYYLLAGVFGISTEDFGTLGKYSEYIFLIAGNIVFVLYDIAISRVSAVYMNLLHPKIKKLMPR
mgnify:CR=1 FL=1